MTKLLTIASAALLALGGPVQAFTASSTYTTYETTCERRPARNAGFIRAAGQTVQINVPARTVCTEQATDRVRSSVHF